MSAKRTKVLSQQGDRTYLVRCKRLWEEQVDEWASNLSARGAEVSSVSKRIVEGRGVLLVEFVEPTGLSEAKLLLEQPEDEIEDELDAVADEVDTASAKGPSKVDVPDEEETAPEEDLFEGPEKDHVYVLSKDLIARVKGDASADPVKLEGGTHVKFAGQDGEQSYIFAVLNGEDRGKLVVWNREEWDAYEKFIVDQGDAKDSPELSNPKKQNPDEMDAPKSPKRDSGDSKVGAGMDAFMRVARSFPDFPARKSLEHYLTRAGQKLYNKPPPEPGEGGGGGGGGFGGF